MRKTERLVAITLLLQAGGKMTAERMADILDVSVRTIYRDMDALSLAHVPVSMDYGPGGGYFLSADYRIEGATFTGDEAVALALGGAIAGGSRLLESNGGLRRALLKLEAVLPEEHRGDVRTVQERVLFDAAEWRRGPPETECLPAARAAVWGGRQLDLLYPRSDAPGSQWRRVEPHGLVFKAGTWYLVAFCRLRQDFRTFRVDRIEAAEMREEETPPRPDFDLKAYWADARRRFEEQVMGFALTLRVTPRGLQRVGADGTLVQTEPDGSAVVRVDLESVEAAVHYALWLGEDGIVLGPPEVCRRVAEVASIIVQRQEAQLARAGASGLESA